MLLVLCVCSVVFILCCLFCVVPSMVFVLLCLLCCNDYAAFVLLCLFCVVCRLLLYLFVVRCRRWLRVVVHAFGVCCCLVVGYRCRFLLLMRFVVVRSFGVCRLLWCCCVLRIVVCVC